MLSNLGHALTGGYFDADTRAYMLREALESLDLALGDVHQLSVAFTAVGS